MKRPYSLPGIIFLLVLVAFALRLYRLDYQPLRGDESFTIQFSGHSLSWLLPNIASVEPNPPLYYFLLHYWMQVLGQSEFVTRFVSLLFGVLSVPLIYLLGKSLGHPAVGALSALLMAINPFQIWHAQDVRNYTLWPALSIAGLVFLLHALQEGKIRYWAGYAGMTLLTLYTHYYDLFMLLFQNLFVLILLVIGRRREPTSSRRRPLLTWLVIQAILTVSYGSWLIYGSSRLLFYTTRGDSPALWAVLSRCLTAFSLGETVPAEFTTASAPFLLLIFLIGLGCALKKQRHLALFLILYILVPSVCIFIAAQVRPLFRERYLNVIAPAYYLTFSYALMVLRDELPRWRMAPLIAGVAFFGLSGAYSLHNYHYNSIYQKSPNWRGLGDYLESQTGPSDVIVLNYPDVAFSYYYHGGSPTFILPRGTLTEDVEMETAQALRLLSERYERIWFYPFEDVGFDSEGFVETWLNRHGRLIDERNIFDFRWLIYQPVLLSADNVQHPLTFRLGEAIWLRGYEFDTGRDEGSESLPVQPGSALRPTLYWEATGEVEMSYTVFIHLIDAQDHIWAQQDSLPQGGDFPTDEWMEGDIIVDRHSVLLPSDTPAGDYLLVGGMYDSRNGQRLPVFDDRGVSQGDRAIIAQVRVE